MNAPAQHPASHGLAQLCGHFALFDRWTEMDSESEGRFLERVAPGAFTRTFAESRDQIRCIYAHGADAQMGLKPLGAVRELEQDEKGARYAVDLFDTRYCRDLLPGLRAGVYGSSFRFRVTHEEVQANPLRSAHNPEGLEERTIVECAVREFGPCTWGAYREATAAIRSNLFDPRLMASRAEPAWRL